MIRNQGCACYIPSRKLESSALPIAGDRQIHEVVLVPWAILDLLPVTLSVLDSARLGKDVSQRNDV